MENAVRTAPGTGCSSCCCGSQIPPRRDCSTPGEEVVVWLGSNLGAALSVGGISAAWGPLRTAPRVRNHPGGGDGDELHRWLLRQLPAVGIWKGSRALEVADTPRVKIDTRGTTLRNLWSRSTSMSWVSWKGFKGSIMTSTPSRACD